MSGGNRFCPFCSLREKITLPHDNITYLQRNDFQLSEPALHAAAPGISILRLGRDLGLIRLDGLRLGVLRGGDVHLGHVVAALAHAQHQVPVLVSADVKLDRPILLILGHIDHQLIIAKGQFGGVLFPGDLLK